MRKWFFFLVLVFDDDDVVDVVLNMSFISHLMVVGSVFVVIVGVYVDGKMFKFKLTTLSGCISSLSLPSWSPLHSLCCSSAPLLLSSF